MDYDTKKKDWFEKTLILAKTKAEIGWGKGREWICHEGRASYDNPSYTVKLWVLEGSVPKAYIVENRPLGKIIVFDSNLKIRKTYSIFMVEC